MGANYMHLPQATLYSTGLCPFLLFEAPRAVHLQCPHDQHQAWLAGGEYLVRPYFSTLLSSGKVESIGHIQTGDRE